MEKQSSPGQITKRKLLAVEGNDEVTFFDELFKHMGMEGIAEVHEVGGKDQFKNKMPALLSITGAGNLEAIAIIRDADDSSENAFKSVIGVLKQNGLQTPEKPGEFCQGNPKVGVFIMPDNCSPGMLENICLETVKDAEEMECVDRFIDCVNELKKLPKEKDIPKARVQAFLAIKPDVPNSIGRGAQKKHWDFDSAELNPLKDFLSQLK
jgi:hypothetical protein